MSNRNFEIYCKNIEDILDNLQKDFNFLYESSSKKIKVDTSENEKLLEEIIFLKNKIIGLENDKNNFVNTTDTKNLECKIKHLIQEIDILKKEKISHLSIIKSLQNEIIDLKGSIRVFLRLRRTDKQSDIEICNDKLNIPYNNKLLNFKYDHIFAQNETQDEIFKEFYPLIESVYDGYKICIFAYGQTGSGKTYTMIGTKENPGLIIKSLDLIFNIKNISADEIQVKFSSFEIYNEEVRNLIDDKSSEVKTFSEAHDALNLSIKNRKTEKTNCNDQSSRSHLICIINIIIQTENETRTGDLCFVDLAGSERINNSKVEGFRLKETQNINKSLSSLGDVIMAILRKDSHVPYRNSKLTFFLQKYFNGKSRVAMICNVNGDNSQRSETISTLRFGAKVSECKLGRIEKAVTRRI